GRHRRRFHRRRLDVRGLGADHGGCHRRFHHGRDEQRHVHHRHRHRLPAGDQGAGPVGRCIFRRLQQEQRSMIMLLSQIRMGNGERAVAAREGRTAWIVPGAASIYAPARTALTEGRLLEEEVAARGKGEPVDLAQALAEGRLLLPIDHPDPAHLHLTGTGLTHLGSASTRNAMHAKSDPETLTDSMKMFRMGMEDGKPEPGRIGVQPEWFYKGNGHTAVAPGGALRSPGFALDAGEEPEIAGIYLIAPDGGPRRLGFALANEFSDHVTERGNYLWLAHSKLRPASFGPELLLGGLPAHVAGTSRILRQGQVRWEKPFVSGED